MHRCATWFALVLLAACGGGGDGATTPTPVTPPPPPPTTTGPNTMSVIAGDGQQGSPGVALTVPPAVLVKDASGRPVVGVSVSFAVDSGGGRVNSPTAVSDANGVATSGGWTLGPQEGANVLVVSSPGIAAVRVRAMAQLVDEVIGDTDIGAAGGTIVVKRAGDALDGFELAVPPATYPQTVHWRVTSRPKLKVELPNGALQFGGGIEIGNNAEYADSAVAVRLPARVGLDTALAVFFYDPATKHLEAMPIAARDETTITVLTNHVRSAFLWSPRPSAGMAAHAQLRAEEFGSVTLVMAGVAPAVLSTPVSTGFAPRNDGWEFTNYGSQIAPGGICVGMSVSAMYYFDRIKPTTGKNLFGQYDLVPNFDWDNPQGIRFASMIQQLSGSSAAMKNRMAALARQGRVPLDVLTYRSLLVSMVVTKRPQLFTIDNGPATLGHAVVAYAVSNGVVSLADPNQPGTNGVTAIFANNAFQPINLQAIASGPPQAYSRAFALGTSTYLPTNVIESEWLRFQGGVAGNGTFIPVIFNWTDRPLVPEWTPLLDSINAWSDAITFGVRCPTCTPTQSRGKVVNRHGNLLLNPMGIEGAFRDSVGVWSEVNSAFVDFHWALVDARPFSFTHVANSLTFVPVTFVARPLGKAPPGAKYVWDFGDSTTIVTVIGDSTVRHTFTTAGQRTVEVQLQDAAGKRLASAANFIGISQKLRLVPQPAGVIDSTYTYVLRGLEDLSGFAWLTWNFGDGTPLVLTQDSIVKHKFAKAGNYKVSVYAGTQDRTSVYDSDEMFVRIYPGEWRISNITLVKSSPTKPNWLPGENRAFNDSLTFYLKQLEDTPSDGMIFFADDSLWREQAVYFQVAPKGTGSGLVYWGGGSQVWLLARQSTIQFSHFTQTGTLWSGDIDGEAYVGLFSGAGIGGAFRNYITATKTGNTLRGTLRFTLHDGSADPAERMYTFVAQLVP